ncbi:Odorant receptor 72, partial [Frankliniella occidentalis]
ERMKQTAHQSSFLLRFYVFYSLTTMFVILITFVAVEPRWHSASAAMLASILRSAGCAELSEASVTALGSCLRWVVVAIQMLTLVFSLTSYYTIVSFIILISGATANVYEVIGHRIE